jgi:hypothetical protein
MCLATVQNGSNVNYMRLKPMTIKNFRFFVIHGDIRSVEVYSSYWRSASLYYCEVSRRNETRSFIC